MHYHMRPIRAIRYLGYVAAGGVLLAVAAVVLTSGSGVPLASPQDDGQTIEVGSGSRFRSISDAVDAAEPGDTVRVAPGVYYETVTLREGIRIEPSSSGEVWIDGECERENGIHVYSGRGAEIAGLGVRNTVAAGVLIGLTGDDADPPEHVTVRDMTIEDFDCRGGDAQSNAGIAVWHSRCCIRLLDNTISYRSDAIVRGMGNGIWFKSTDDAPSGGDHLVARNAIIGGWDGIGGEAEGDTHGSFDRATLIEGNFITGCWDDGIQSEGGNQEITIRDNEITGCGTGIAFAPTLLGPLIIFSNEIRDLDTGLYDNKFCFKTGGETDDGGIVYLTENTCETEGDGLLQTNSGLPAIVARRNCFQVTRYVIQLGDEVRDGTSFNRDTLWTSDPSRFVDWDGEQYASLEEFHETGHEADGQQSDRC
jgi:hypothetical protein